MIYETYQCSLRSGNIEYGYTFKLDEDSEDCEFDLVLGHGNPNDPFLSVAISTAFAQYEWAALAIICAEHDKEHNK